MCAAGHTDLIAEHQGTIIKCLDDKDETIQARALDLVSLAGPSPALSDLVSIARPLRQMRG